MSTSSTATIAQSYSPAALRRYADLGYRYLGDDCGCFRHRACGQTTILDPTAHEAKCEIGKIKARGYVPIDADDLGKGYVHVACQSRADNMDRHDIECHGRHR